MDDAAGAEAVDVTVLPDSTELATIDEPGELETQDVTIDVTVEDAVDAEVVDQVEDVPDVELGSADVDSVPESQRFSWKGRGHEHGAGNGPGIKGGASASKGRRRLGGGGSTGGGGGGFTLFRFDLFRGAGSGNSLIKTGDVASIKPSGNSLLGGGARRHRTNAFGMRKG